MNSNSAKETRSVFISVGHHLSPKQDHFVQLINDQLRELNTVPTVIARNAQMIADPIATIRNVIRKSAGTIIIAFERYRIVNCLEFPKSESPIPLEPRSLATVWNQIEAAMTLQIEHPLLILSEAEIHPEGVIDPAIHPTISFDCEAVTDQLPEEIQRALRAWCGWL